mgnify:CR=1 FL=1
MSTILNDPEWEEKKKEFYKKPIVINYEKGYIDFSKNGMKDVKHGESLSYDEYLDAQRAFGDKYRRYLAILFFDGFDGYFKGQITRFDYEKKKVLFKRLFVDGMYSDGIGFFGKEDHVWMDIEPFKDFSVNDCIGFRATVYRYLRNSSPKSIDFGLENPEDIEKIADYEIPSDEDLVNQQIEQLVCETCMFHDHCFMGDCIANKKWRQKRIDTLKSLQPGKFTPFTVMLAYELEYRICKQSGGLKVSNDDPNCEIIKKIEKICDETPIRYYGDIKEVLFKMFHPEKDRMYIED